MNNETPVVEAAPIAEQPIVEQPVEQAPSEVQPEAQPASEPVDAPIEMDFSGIAPQYQQPAQPEQPDYESVIEQIIARTLEKTQPLQQQPTIEAEDEDGVITRKDLQSYKEQVKQEFYAEMQRSQEANTIIETNKQASMKVEQNYAAKVTETLKQHGIDIQNDAVLKNAADLLFVQLKTQKALQLGRPLSNPVLTPYETEELVKQHWQALSQNFLPSRKTQPQAAIQAGLSPAANGISNPGERAPVANEFQEYQRKTEDGTVKMRDALKILTRGPSQNG